MAENAGQECHVTQPGNIRRLLLASFLRGRASLWMFECEKYMFCSLKQTGDYIEPCRLVIIIPKISEIMLVEVIEYDKNIKIVFLLKLKIVKISTLKI